MYIAKHIDPSVATTPGTNMSGLFFDLNGVLWYIREDGTKEPVAPSEFVVHTTDGSLDSTYIGKGVSLLNSGLASIYATSSFFFGTLKAINGSTAILDCNTFQTIKLDASNDASFLLPKTYIVYVNIIAGGTVILSDTSTANTIGMYIYNSYDSILNTIKMKLFTSSDLIFIERNVDIVGIFDDSL